MFSATWSREVRTIANDYISNPVVVQVGSDEVTGNKNITQHIEVTSSKEEKTATLHRILDNLGFASNCLVFCNTKRNCRDLAWELNQGGKYTSVELHGDLS